LKTGRVSLGFDHGQFQQRETVEILKQEKRFKSQLRMLSNSKRAELEGAVN
jgi:hypothetical protein